MQYVVVYEQAPENWATYVPDLPGCVAAADAREEVEQLIREAIVLYLEALQERGDPAPEAGRWTQLIEP
jgi:predicted RNase H-like HicB family nuclease